MGLRLDIRPEEISNIIKNQIKNYENKAEEAEIGTVITCGDGIVRAFGLDDCMANELVVFEGGEEGMAMNLEEETVSIVLLDDGTEIREGSKVKRTGRVVSVPVGDGMIGRIVNALGKPIDGKGPIDTTETRPIEHEAPGIIKRKSVSVPLQTGIKAIDSMIPIGRGQRELIVGDRQTGKTTIALDTILNQKGKDVICVYVAIGQKNSTIANIAETVRKNGADSYTVIVAASASEGSPLQYIAPYSGCAIAEYFMAQGKDVLIVYDDLSKHAVAYRALSLLIRRPPGREAYPGDVFYLHSRLLERAARVALETELFHSGVVPAVNPGISVSRVGGSAQIKAMKKVASKLKLLYSQYIELKSFAQFGSDLDADTKERLALGERIVEILKQDKSSPVPVEKQVAIIYAATNGYLNDVKVPDVSAYEKEFYEFLDLRYSDLLDIVRKTGKLEDSGFETLAEACREFTEKFRREHYHITSEN